MNSAPDHSEYCLHRKIKCLYLRAWRVEKVREKCKMYKKYPPLKLEMTISSVHFPLTQLQPTELLLNTGKTKTIVLCHWVRTSLIGIWVWSPSTTNASKRSFGASKEDKNQHLILNNRVEGKEDSVTILWNKVEFEL